MRLGIAVIPVLDFHGMVTTRLGGPVIGLVTVDIQNLGIPVSVHIITTIITEIVV